MEETVNLLTMKTKRQDNETGSDKPLTVPELIERNQKQKREGGEPKPAPDSDIEEIADGALASISTQPMKPNIVEFKIGAQTIKLGTGLYLVTGGAGAGKSVLALGLAFCARKYAKLQAGHLYFFEHNAPSYKNRGDVRKFSDPKRFLDVGQESGDLVDHLGTFIKTRSAMQPPAVIVLDSIGIPMRSFTPEDRRGQTAAEQGMQPADRLFTEQLDLLGTTRALIILGVVNSELVPFAAKLYGAAQGLINVTAANTFTKNDRAGGRTGELHELPHVATKSALATMRYNTKQKEQ